MNIKKGDTIYIISGKDRGKTGTVDKVFPEKNKILVAGVNIVKKHAKPTKKNPKGGTVDWPLPFDVSNAMIVCQKCNKATRIKYMFINNKKTRMCSRCSSSIGTGK